MSPSPDITDLQRGRDLVGRSHGLLYQRERAAEGDAHLSQPWVVRGDGDVRQHLHLHAANVPPHLHQVSQSLLLERGRIPPPGVRWVHERGCHFAVWLLFYAARGAHLEDNPRTKRWREVTC